MCVSRFKEVKVDSQVFVSLSTHGYEVFVEG